MIIDPKSITDKELREKLSQLFSSIDAGFEKTRAEFLKERLSSQIDLSLPRAQVIGVINLGNSILSDHKKAAQRSRNVKSQLESVRKRTSAKGIGVLDGANAAIAVSRGVDVGRDFIDQSLSYREKLDLIKERSQDLFGINGPSQEYVRLLKTADHECREESRLHAARLINLVNKGIDLSLEEKKHFDVERSRKNYNSRVAGNFAAQKAKDLFSYLGRDFYSKSDPAKSKRYKDYTQKRNKMVEDLYLKYAPDRGSKAQIAAELRRLLDSANIDENGMMDQITFNRLSQLLAKEGAKDSKDAKAISDEMNKLNEEALNLSKEHTSSEDQKWKWRLLQVALILTPFCGISLLGPLFGAASSVLGSGGLSGGITSLMTCDALGPLGDFVKLIRLDDAVSWVLTDCPIIGDVVGVADSLIVNDIAQPILGGAFSILSTPLVPVLIGGAYALKRLPGELSDKQSFDKKFKDQQKKLEDKIAELGKKERAQDSDFKELSEEKFKVHSDAFEANGIASVFEAMKNFNPAEIENLSEKLFGKDLTDILLNSGCIAPNFLDLRRLKEVLLDLKLSPEEDKKKQYQDFFDRYLLFRHVDKVADIGDGFEEKIIKFKDMLSSADAKRIIENEKKYFFQDFSFEVGRVRGVPFDQGALQGSVEQRQAEADAVKQKVIEQEAEKFKKLVEDNKKKPGEHGHVDIKDLSKFMTYFSGTDSTSPSRSSSSRPSTHQPNIMVI